MNKALSIFILVVLMTVSLAACGEKATNTDDTTKKEESTTAKAETSDSKAETGDSKGETKGGYKVASHNAVIEGNPYRAVYENQMSSQADELKEAGVISEYNSFVANNDPALETQQLEQSINDGYDIIIVNPIAASGLDPIIEKATEAGVTYVNADCIYDSDKIVNVVVDQGEWARIQAKWVIETLGEGGKVVQFNGIDGNSASEIRSDVWTEELANGGVEVVKTVAHNWSDVEAKQLMSEIISSGLEYDGIINQEGANGIMDAIQEANIDYPGCITSSEEVAWIRRIADINKDGLVMPFIVVENPPGIGSTALAIAVNLREGNELDESKLSEDNTIYYAPKWVMTYENMQEKLDSIADLPDSTSVSSYMSVEDAKAAYFK